MPTDRQCRGASPAAWKRAGAPRRALLAVLLSSLPVTGGLAQDTARTDRLRELERSIAGEQQRLQAARGEREALLAELALSERDAAVVLRRLRQLESALARRSDELDALQRQRSNRAGAIQALRAQLAAQVRASFRVGRNDYLKLVLNQQDPQRVGRVLAYHGYVARARAARIDALTAELARLQDLEHAIEAETAELRELAAAARAAREEHGLQRQRRQQALAALGGRISAGRSRIEALRRDASALEQVLQRVSAAEPRTRPIVRQGDIETPERATFASQRGTLPWPTTGQVSSRFGGPRGDTQMTWRGVRLSAPAGQPILAVAGGRVVFADWLRGFGLLTIIEHGDGYMSLYGHARELLKGAGDWVEAGETIGTVGDSGGQSESGLYFEIRHQGQPQDPAGWCAGAPDRRSAALVR